MVNPILAGSRLLAEDLLAWSDAINFLLDPPGAQLRQTVAQSASSGAFTAVTFTAEDYDNRSGHSTSVNTSRYTCQVAGRYQVSGKVTWAANATGQRGSAWHVNGSLINASQISVPAVNASAAYSYAAATMTVLLAAGDYVELHAFQDTGGSLSTSVAAVQLQSYVHIRWVGTT